VTQATDNIELLGKFKGCINMWLWYHLPMNNTYEIEIKSPLLRPGIVIRTEVSEKYVLPVLEQMLIMVRQHNIDFGIEDES